MDPSFTSRPAGTSSDPEGHALNADNQPAGQGGSAPSLIGRPPRSTSAMPGVDPGLEPDPEMVDSLASLFLGDGPLSPGTSDPADRAHQAPMGDETPMLRLVDAFEPEDFQADPFSQSTDDLDQGFEWDDDALLADIEPAPSALHADDASIEALVLGHLPVSASGWSLQHAAARARTLDQRVAFVSLKRGRVDLQLISPQPETSKAMRPASDEPLAAALRWLASRARHWVICVDHAEEASLSEASELDAMTVLTGADDPAVIDCYRTLKAIERDLETALGDDDALPALGVSIVGAPRHRASHAAARLEAACRDFLDVETLDVCSIPQMQAVHAVHAGSHDFDDPCPLLIALVRDALDCTPAWSPEDALDDEDDPFDDEAPQAWIQREPADHAWLHGADAPASMAREAAEDEGTLSAVQLVGGLSALAFECPVAKQVELATDAEGQLHLVALDADDASTVGELTRARAWAREHASLLKAAAPDLQEVSTPHLHVLTTRAALVRTLIETDITVHVMAHASQARQGWIVQPLNSDRL